MMEDFYSDETAIYNRISFITGQPVKNYVRPCILESWTRSRNEGIDPRTTVLPLPPLSVDPSSRLVDDKWLYRSAMLNEYRFKLIDALSKTDSAIFYLNPSLTMASQFGNTKLLESLNDKNLSVGANLSENIVGTNAVALAASLKTDVWVIGAEHYIEALQPYACSAVPFFDENNDSYAHLYAMIITAKSNFGPFLHNMLYYYSIMAKSVISLGWRNTESCMIDEFLNLSLLQNAKGMMIVNNYGLILKINPWFERTLGISEQEVRGTFLKDVLPELRHAVDCMQTGESIPLHEVHLQRPLNNNRSLFMECQPIKKDGKFIGASIFLQDKKSVHKVVSQVANYSARFHFHDLIGSSSTFSAVKKIAQKAAEGQSTLLLVGESGTGKELFAQAIHNASNRRNGPFISINCAAIPKELIGSELFGYMEGAFTGARKGGAPGKFELAHKGTLFLDEIGEMPLDMQSVLLRVLEQKEFVRLGGSDYIPVDVRVVAATNKDLQQSVTAKEFRLDLYYRLNVINIELPALRNRKGDIPLLINNFINQFNSSLNKNVIEVTPEALDLLLNYNWPGNIRELRNVVERAINLSSSPVIQPNDLPKEILIGNTTTRTESISLLQPYSTNVYHQRIAEQFTEKINENNQILALLDKYAGNKARVARDLGITRATLYRKLKLMGYD